MTSIATTFRANLRRAIQAHPDSATRICQRAGYDRTYVGKVMSGRKPNPTLYFVECMAAALGAEPLELLTGLGYVPVPEKEKL